MSVSTAHTSPASSAEELAEIEELVYRILTDGSTPGSQVSRNLWLRIEEAGFTDLTRPAERGGGGAGWREAAAALRAVGRSGVAVPLAEHDLLAGWLLERAGLTLEPAQIRTYATLKDGRASRVAWAGEVDRIVVLWEEDRTWRVAEMESGSVRRVPGANLAGESCDAITVDTSALAGGEVDGRVAAELLLRKALTRCLLMAGAADRVLDLMAEHVKTREQFGRPIVRFQAVQHMVADVAAEAAFLQASALAAVSGVDDAGFANPATEFAVTAATLGCAHAVPTIVRNAHQALGAMGYTQEHDLHRFTNRLLAWRSDCGSVRDWDERLLDLAKAAGPGGLWPLLVDGTEQQVRGRGHDE